jgi:RND superfamily putative drug exporter
MSALARWCYQHRIAVVGLWVVLLLALGGASAVAGTSYSEEFSLPGTESTKALELLQAQLPDSSGDSDQIVVHVDSGSVKDAAVQQKVSGMLAQVEKLPSVSGVTSMYSEQGAGQISADGKTAYATVQFDKLANELALPDIEKVVDTAQAARGDGLQVELGGQAIQEATQAPPGSSELIGIVAAAIILFLAFGSLLGMLLPLLVALAGVGSGLLAVGLLSHGVTLSSIAPTLAALIGLGVGIDYALFIVTRHRAGLQGGLSPEEAAVRAVNTSGRAVLFAGGTVVIALLGLLVLRLNFLNGLGIGSAVAVAFTILAALTLLPAMLGFFGNRLISKKQRQSLITDGPRVAGASGVWARWAVFVGRHKAVFSIVALVAIVLMSIPTLSIRLGSSDAGNDKADTTTRKAYDLLADGFGPGFNGTLQLVGEVATPADSQAFTKLLDTVKSTDGVAAVSPLPSKPGATVAIAIVVPTTAPQDEATNELIDRLRDDVVPAAEQGNTMQVYVGGSTAIFKDFAGVLTSKLPLFLGVIIALGCLLLMIAFRSILVPLTAAVMNVFAAAASFGVVVAIFQWGWGSSFLNLGGAGPVEAFVPVIMLAILFGLSMDYQVFLVSRMHEEWTHTRDNERAIRIGQAETGRVITAAALIMIFVFGAFILDGQRVIAEFGIGLAAAVAIDAFILRTVLVPALMHLFGPANWWLPGWLDRILPHLSVEGEPDDRPAEPVDPTGRPIDPRSEDDALITSPRG